MAEYTSADGEGPFPCHGELERAIDANPDDDTALLVYADWLQQQGEPAGELIALQCALARADGIDRERLRSAEAALLASPRLLGDLHARSSALRITWRKGLVHAVRVAPVPAATPELVQQVLTLPLARWLRGLAVGGKFVGGVSAVVGLLSTHEAPATLQTLELDATSETLEIGPLLLRLPRLIDLTLVCDKLDLGAHPLGLRRFSLWGRVSSATVKALCDQCSSIEALALADGYHRTSVDVLRQVHDGGNDEDDDFVIQDLDGILDGQALPALHELKIMAPFANALCARLARRPAVVSRLSRLTVGTDLTDDGARLLASAARGFTCLETLDVSNNELGRDGRVALRRAFGDRVVLQRS